MNAQEREQLSLFLQQLTHVQAGQKDSDADALIREACARQPDAGYLLVQRSMQLEHALRAATAQCSQLQAELDKARTGTQSSFLGNANTWGRQPPAAASGAAPVAANSGAAMPPRPQAAAPAPSSWGSGILGTVATTAAGVVAGSFLFQGINNLMGHHNQNGLDSLNSSANQPHSLADNTASNSDYDGRGPDENSFAVADSGADSGADETA